jgi:hypothetical protein
MKIETKNRNTDQTFETTSFKDTGEVFNDISLKKENRLFFDKISLSEITEFLKVKSIRSAIAWCKKNSVKIFENGKLKYINFLDYQLAIDAPFIESLKIKHPKNWNEIYGYYKNFDYKNLVLQISPSKHLKARKFSVQGKVANSFLNKMNSNF